MQEIKGKGEWQTRSNVRDLAAGRGLDDHPAFRQRLVVCFYLPNTPAKKKSQEEIGLCSKEEPKQGERGPDLETFFDCTAVQSPGGWDDPSLLSGVTKVLGTQRAPGRGKMGTRAPHHTHSLWVGLMATTFGLLKGRSVGAKMVAWGDLPSLGNQTM